MRSRSRLTHGWLALALLIPSASAFAQSGGVDQQGPPAPPKIVKNCRNNQTNEIVVCGSNERSPYRLPPPRPGFDPDAGTDSVSRERHGLYEVGDSGIGSCSTSGPGGGGCMAQSFKRYREQTDGHGKKGVVAKIRDRNEPEEPR